MVHKLRNQIIMSQFVSWFDLFEYLKNFLKVVVDMKTLLIVTWDMSSLYIVTLLFDSGEKILHEFALS